METKYTVMHPDGRTDVGVIDWPENPGYDRLASLMSKLLEPGAFLDHVTVLHEGHFTDMFVDDNGHGRGWARNEKATAIYRHNWLSSHPTVDPENLHFVVGIAVLFHRKVWN